jgi:hypothetical protein
VAYWEVDGKGEYRGYDVFNDPEISTYWNNLNLCEFTESWKRAGDPIVPPGTIRDIPVFKDLCTYTNAKGMTCNKWKDLSCQSSPSQADSGVRCSPANAAG